MIAAPTMIRTLPRWSSRNLPNSSKARRTSRGLRIMCLPLIMIEELR
jgi:hypothetical protein